MSNEDIYDNGYRDGLAARPKRVGCGVAVILVDRHHPSDLERVLMHKRKGAHGAGTWSFIGGWLEYGESFLDAARREAYEEAGVQLGSIRVVDAMSTVFPEGKHSVTILTVADGWQGTPTAMEPDKIDGEWTWFPVGALPEPLFLPLTQSGVMTKLRAGTIPW